MMRKIGIAFIIAGIVLTICAGGWLAWNECDENRAGEAVDTALQTLSVAMHEENISAIQAETPNEEMPVIVVEGKAYIGTLSIPELGLELPIQAECTDENLKNTPCRYSGSLKSGDLVIAGHNYKRHFTKVKRLKPGAKILFRDAENNDYEFVVHAVETIAADDIQKMIESQGDWDLTLFTCTYGGRDRVAIRCVRTR